MNNEKYIWNFLLQQGFTECGVAGLIGNLHAESALNSGNLQNSYSKSLGMTDLEYTQSVDNGSYSNFIYDKAGYGLAQWTHWSRKEKLLQYAQSNGVSIGDLDMQLNFLIQELNRYFKPVINILKTTQSVEEASNTVMLKFEKPANQSIENQKRRALICQSFYDRYARSEIKMKYSASNPPLACILTNSSCYKESSNMNKTVGVLWHCTGANNPALCRYVQPLETDANYEQMIQVLGKNKYNNDYNHVANRKGVNAWIGKLADNSVASVQTLPWNMRPWGCGTGSKGSCNDGWIQFEICEDGLTDPTYFEAIYKEGCELTAYLCILFNIDPEGTVVLNNGDRLPTILCHSESAEYGYGSNHSDVMHWFKKYGKTMNDVRKDVKSLITTYKSNIPIYPPAPAVPQTQPTIQIPQTQIVTLTQEQFNQMMNNYLKQQANASPDAWSANARAFVERNNIMSGDSSGNRMYKKFMTREEFAAIIWNLYERFSKL